EEAEDLVALGGVGVGCWRLMRNIELEAMAAGAVALIGGSDDLRDDRADVDAVDLDVQVTGVEPRDDQQLVDDLRQPLGFRSYVAEEGAAVLFPERNVLAQERLGETVDGRERRPQLV